MYTAARPPLLDNIDFSKAVMDDEGHLLRLTLTDDEQYRLYTPLNQIAKPLILATLLQEDDYFYHHIGINPWALVKATWQSFFKRTYRMGASTITMQVVRLRDHLNTKTIQGKMIQIYRALQIERYYTKNQILTAYFNLAPYGYNIQGVGAASLLYFNQTPHKLTLPEALTLAVIPQNPVVRPTFDHRLLSIRERLMNRWQARNKPSMSNKSVYFLPLEKRFDRYHPTFIAPHFVQTSLKQSHSHGLVETALNQRLQHRLEAITTQYLARQAALGVNNAAFMIVDTNDMRVKASLGSGDFFNVALSGQIDGTQINRSPGSALKPFIYGLALDQGLIHPNTLLRDLPTQFGEYHPDNFDHDFMGPIKAKDALILSRNIPAIDLLNQLHHPTLYDLLETAKIHHLKPEHQYGLSLALGGAEMSLSELISLYAALNNQGLWHPLRYLKNTPFDEGQRLLSPEASFLILELLKNTPRPRIAQWVDQYHPLTVSWKTGTSSGFRDAWSVGIVGHYAVGVWMGNFNQKSNQALVGKSMAAPLFFELINGLKQWDEEGVQNTRSTAGLNLIQLDVCQASGLLPTNACPTLEKTWFIPKKSPIKTDTIFREIAIDPKTGLRACEITSNTLMKVYEFWPSDYLALFEKAGIHKNTPPPYRAECPFINNQTHPPQIVSPKSGLRYILTDKNKTIPLTAITDGDVKKSYWFMNQTFLGTSKPNEALRWQAKPGDFQIRVVDDHGMTDRVQVRVMTN